MSISGSIASDPGRNPAEIAERKRFALHMREESLGHHNKTEEEEEESSKKKKSPRRRRRRSETGVRKGERRSSRRRRGKSYRNENVVIGTVVGGEEEVGGGAGGDHGGSPDQLVRPRIHRAATDPQRRLFRRETQREARPRSPGFQRLGL